MSVYVSAVGANENKSSRCAWGFRGQSLPVFDAQPSLGYKKTPLEYLFPRVVKLKDLIALFHDSYKSYPLPIQYVPYYHYFLNEGCDCSEQPYGVEAAS
jgi:hypothetical protein